MKRWFRQESVARDWFGLDVFQVGPRFLRDSGILYLLDEVGSTSEFLRGGGDPARGRLCTWDGWGWKARKQALLDPVTSPTPGTVVVARQQTVGRGRQGKGKRKAESGEPKAGSGEKRPRTALRGGWCGANQQRTALGKIGPFG